RGLVHHSRIVEKQIRRAVAEQQFLRPCFHLREVGYVHNGKIIWPRKLFLKRRNFLFRTPAADDGMAEADKFFCESASASTRDAGNKNDFRHKLRMWLSRHLPVLDRI